MALDRITQFERWLKTANPGWGIVYHEGNLLVDRGHTFYKGGRMTYVPHFGETDEVATLVWNAYLNGEVELVQRKCGDGHYQYIAYRRLVPRKVKWIGGRHD